MLRSNRITDAIPLLWTLHRHFAPHQDAGSDFSKEWETAMGLRRSKQE
jgi:hypothetical protein